MLLLSFSLNIFFIVVVIFRSRLEMRAVFVLLGLIAAVNAVSFTDVIKEEWKAFKVRFEMQRSFVVVFYFNFLFFI